MATTGIGPQVVQVLDFAQARAPELLALHELSHRAQSGAVAPQANVRRRRANAFKSHAMPRRLRLRGARARQAPAEEELIKLSAAAASKASTASESASKQPNKAKGPRCRKHRRRMHSLLADRSWWPLTAASDGESAHAEDKPKWLATHRWHAKRMLMEPRYGHVLAVRRQDKSVSAALTALRQRAVVHDISYYGVLELVGPASLIFEALQPLTDPMGSRLLEEVWLDGRNEARDMLYHAGQFPMGLIAPVRFMWHPLPSDYDASGAFTLDQATLGTTIRQLWLWIHPAAFMEAATAIATACREVMTDRDESETIEILDRRGHLTRFEVRGRDANAMLQQVLRPVPSKESRVESTAAGNETGFVSQLNEFPLKQEDQPVATPLIPFTVADPRANTTRLQEAIAAASQPKTSELSLLLEPSSVEERDEDIIRCPFSGAPLAKPRRGRTRLGPYSAATERVASLDS
ncbi:hypothetical protein PINS_up018211 [Pythium insidiosum]|nr:hypothetical protein PINS_up018211 [Pythium insidiosum]